MAQPKHNAQERFSYGDYLHWPEGERWELIDGAAYDMTPAPAPKHQKLLTDLLTQIYLFLKGHECDVYPAPFDVRLPESDEADEDIFTVVQPDLSVVCDRKKLDDRGCRGAPDLIIEILSPSTASHDLIRKAALYERHGVREYWIVHPQDRIVILRTLEAPGRYGMPRFVEAKGKLPVQVLPGLELDLDAAFATLSEG